MTTAALTVPIFLLRRQRAKTLLNVTPPKRNGDKAALEGRFTPIPSPDPSAAPRSTPWPPPRRRSGTALTGPASIATKTPTLLPAGKHIVHPTPHPRRPTAAPPPEEEFNAFYGAGALGIATLLVGASALVGVWGIRTFMEVDTVRTPPSFHSLSSV